MPAIGHPAPLPDRPPSVIAEEAIAVAQKVAGEQEVDAEEALAMERT